MEILSTAYVVCDISVLYKLQLHVGGDVA